MTVYDPQNQSEKNGKSGDSLRDQWQQYQQDQVLDAELARELGKVKNFQMGLMEQSPRLWVTPAILALNILMFVVMVATGVSLMSPTGLEVLKWGASNGILTLNGDWWRLLTATIIHIGLIHLLVNMYSLYILGPAVERLFQPLGYFTLYWLSGLGGSLASVWWQPTVTSAGASGAIFGVFGALLGFGFRQKETLPHSVFVNLRNSGLMILGINFVLGLSVDAIDMAGHMGGLAVGFALAMVMSQPVGLSYSSKRRNLALAALFLGTGLSVGVYFLLPRTAVSNELEQLRIRQLIETSTSRKNSSAIQAYRAAVRRFSKKNKELSLAFDKIRAKASKGKVSPMAFATFLLSQQVPEWRKSSNYFATVPAEDLPSFYSKKLALLLKYIKARENHVYYLGKGIQSNDNAMVKKADAMLQQSFALLSQYKQQ
ncbi:MAG: rhomboid family intramembrane serine protease [Deltaproteobacteria bacterium]|nr:MAG: rhomboid family intramembrane serine protease [Deltaproteobacteria bacterium]